MLVPIHMIIVHQVDRPQLVVLAEVTPSEYKLDKIAAVHCKQLDDRETHMALHKALEQQNDEKLKGKLKRKVQVLHEYEGYENQFLDIVTTF